MSVQQKREYAKTLNSQQAAHGLVWTSTRGEEVAAQIRAYKARVASHQLDAGIGWGYWYGNAEAVFRAVPVNWECLSDAEGWALYEAVRLRVAKAMIQDYRARVEAYQRGRGLEWSAWKGDAVSVFNAVKADWELIGDDEGEVLYEAIARKVEHENRGRV